MFINNTDEFCVFIYNFYILSIAFFIAIINNDNFVEFYRIKILVRYNRFYKIT